jgi:dihydroorotate dehydrogenase (fumarate)
MELNLSCPNIPGAAPPAYSPSALAAYLSALNIIRADLALKTPPALRVLIGIKTPPYTHAGQFADLVGALEAFSAEECPVAFITATNTLGNCIVHRRGGAGETALKSAAGDGVGGLAGAALHPLALGNVKALRRCLDASGLESVKGVEIIGVGGVADKEGFDRMKGVGAAAVGVATALGREGVGVFGKIIEN